MNTKSFVLLAAVAVTSGCNLSKEDVYKSYPNLIVGHWGGVKFETYLDNVFIKYIEEYNPEDVFFDDSGLYWFDSSDYPYKGRYDVFRKTLTIWEIEDPDDSSPEVPQTYEIELLDGQNLILKADVRVCDEDSGEWPSVEDIWYDFGVKADVGQRILQRAYYIRQPIAE